MAAGCFGAGFFGVAVPQGVKFVEQLGFVGQVVVEDGLVVSVLGAAAAGDDAWPASKPPHSFAKFI